MSKVAISAKLESNLLEETDRIAGKLHIARNRAVEEGLRLWIRKKSREMLAQQMKAASLATQKESREIANEWANANMDGLHEDDEP